MVLFAHCAPLTVNAVKHLWERKPLAHDTGNRLATVVNLDITTHWTPTVGMYLGRINKAHILNAVRDAAGEEAAERLSDLKKQPMAEAAEQLLAGTGWLPAVLRTPEPAVFAERQDEEGVDARSADVAEAEPEAPEADTTNAALADSSSLAEGANPSTSPPNKRRPEPPGGSGQLSVGEFPGRANGAPGDLDLRTAAMRS
ncbi:hypothetical protein [Mesorhizobium sp. AR10]|uniref:hypothetical protein n=1 Tax=Mesorhizobium sp. AR10 TaxID=2865839 RepID=UPI0039B6F254